MRFWLITIGEPLPTDGEGDRLLRTGLLAERLLKAGHEVVWWSSGFDHIRKRHRSSIAGSVAVSSGLTLKLLASSGYRQNVSFQRLMDHRQLAASFRKEAPTCPLPDLILCSWPTLELCDEAVAYGQARQIPVILDIRDMWPDVLVNVVPSLVRPLARLCAAPLYRMARRSCQNSTAITAITDGCIDWARGLADMTREVQDRAFPLAYREKSPSDAEQTEAASFWGKQGVLKDGKLTACFFGTFGRQFELDTMLQAARLLHKANAPIQFVLCGAGPELQHCRTQAADLPNVLLPGWVNAAQIWTLMRTSSVGLAPYRSTFDFRMSIPNKSIEYLSAGLPVVSSLQGTLANLLDRNQAGLTYSNDSPSQLAAGLQRLHAEPGTREALSRNATALYRRQFVAETVYDEMVDYLSQFVSQQRVNRAA